MKCVYTAAPHFHCTVIPGTLLLKLPLQTTEPPIVPEKPAGTGNASPSRKISSLPEIGTVVIQVLVMESNVVEAQEALGEKVIWALGADRVCPVSPKAIVEPVKVIVAPVLGTPLAAKFALNQMKVPPLMCVPLKLEEFDEGELQGGPEAAGQLSGLGEKLMAIELKGFPAPSTKVAVPDREKLPVRGPAALVWEALKLPLASAKTASESLTVTVDPELSVTRIV